ncbi:MAG TPA: metalloregulator ArsR/SmtB family transcription factor [Rhodocyclaceae bacterium]|jgi:ArsR family transcriptional regulator
MSKKPVVDLDEVIKALANPLRREILAWLKNPEKEFKQQDHPFEFGVCVGKIFERSGLSQSTVSAHLATLQSAGLVTPRKVGQWVFYKRNEEAIQAFLSRIGHEL